MTREVRDFAKNRIEYLLKISSFVFDERDKEALEMAIQALSQEPCDDAISRDAALEKMADYVASGYADSVEDFEEYSRIICELFSVTQKSGKWIPFSERLPKPFEHCLITTTDGEVIYHYDDGQYSKYKAWMPLPKPYESQESEVSE